MTILNLKTSERQGAVHVELAGELDIATAAQLDDEMQRLEAEGRQLVVLDLRPLEFMDSSGLRALLSADSRARELGRRLVIVRGDDRVQRVLRITRLDERLELVDDADSLAATG
jgi:anti-anti-sigma factor